MVPADLPNFKVFRVQESLEFPDEAIPNTPLASAPEPNVDMEDVSLACLGQNAIAKCSPIQDMEPKGDAEAVSQPPQKRRKLPESFNHLKEKDVEKDMLVAENGSQEATCFPSQQQPLSVEHSSVATLNMDIGAGIVKYPTEKAQQKVGEPMASQPSDMDLNVDTGTSIVQCSKEKEDQQQQEQDSADAASSSKPQDAAAGQEQDSKKAMSSEEKQGDGKGNDDQGEEAGKDITQQFLPMLEKKKKDPEVSAETQKDMFKNADILVPGIALKKFALALSEENAPSTYMAVLGVENFTMYKLARPKLCGICMGDFNASPEEFWAQTMSHLGTKAIAAIFVHLEAGFSTADDT